MFGWVQAKPMESCLVVVFMTLLKNTGKFFPILNNSMLYQDIYRIYICYLQEFLHENTSHLSAFVGCVVDSSGPCSAQMCRKCIMLTDIYVTWT